MPEVATSVLLSLSPTATVSLTTAGDGGGCG